MTGSCFKCSGSSFIIPTCWNSFDRLASDKHAYSRMKRWWMQTSLPKIRRSKNIIQSSKDQTMSSKHSTCEKSSRTPYSRLQIVKTRFYIYFPWGLGSKCEYLPWTLFKTFDWRENYSLFSMGFKQLIATSWCQVRSTYRRKKLRPLEGSGCPERSLPDSFLEQLCCRECLVIFVWLTLSVALWTCRQKKVDERNGFLWCDPYL